MADELRLPNVTETSVDVFLPTAEIKHEFSSPWKNSDLVLIIEDQKIHVHRVILQMTSPVLSNFVQETDSSEVSLPRINVSEFVDLLRVIYPQFENKITLYNIEHIYKLAEEYQIESVIRICREYLVLVKKETTNAMKILAIAQVCKSDEAREQCYEILKGWTVAGLKRDKHFDDLDEQSVRSILLPKAERLEKCLTEVQPQLVGLIDCVLYLWLYEGNRNEMNGKPRQCPEHQQYTRANTSMQSRMKCSVCKQMFLQMARNSRNDQFGAKLNSRQAVTYYSKTGAYFDEKIVDILQEMFSLLKL